MPGKIYHLECEPDGCRVTGIINGLPFYFANGINAPVLISKPINSVLIGKDNSVKLILEPPFKGAIETHPSPYSIKVKVKLYALHDITGPENGRVIFEQKYENTLISNFKFNNEDFNFRHRLITPPILKKEEVIIYAEKLRIILSGKEIDLVLNEFKEKLNDYALVYGDATQTMYNGFKEFLQSNYYPNNPRLDFTTDDLVFDQWCDDRVWQISVGFEREEFMLAGPDSEEMEYATKVFVAKINNRIQVIR